MKEKKQVDTRSGLKVVTSNDFITACGLEDISLKARKLLYITISQCRKTDEEFFKYRISVIEFAELMGIDPSNLYKVDKEDKYKRSEVEKITDELIKGFIKVKSGGKKGFNSYPLFACCEANESYIEFELNKKMTDFFLKLKGNFTQPLLDDFLKMNSPYSMAIWHLMQREMKSKKSYGNHVIEFDLSLDELRQVTGTQEKLKQLVHFKERVLDKAIREIKDNCTVVITYENIKDGRTVTGFHFKAYSPNYMPVEKMSAEHLDKLEEIQKKFSTPEELESYNAEWQK